MLWYFYTDYLKAGVKSIRGFIGGPIYSNNIGFYEFFLVWTKHQNKQGLLYVAFLMDKISLCFTLLSSHFSKEVLLIYCFQSLAYLIIIPKIFLYIIELGQTGN